MDIASYADYFHGIKSAVTKTTNLLSQFSDYAKNQEPESEVVDMNIVVADLTKIFKGSLKNKVELEITFLDHPALAFANKIHIEQVLLNIIINAEHAIISRLGESSGKGLIKMTILKAAGIENAELDDEKDYLKIDIIDNGAGMSSETMEDIFNPYFTTRGAEGGTGLGLAVAQNIVQSHNGIIQVSSDIGKGSSFSIYFPFYSSN